MRYVDLSHEIHHEMITYKGLPAPLICDYLSREDSRPYYDGKTTFQIAKVEMVGNTGTYIDCPLHRYHDGKDFCEYFVSDLADLPGLKVHQPFDRHLAVDVDLFQDLDVKGKAILIHTGWSKFWRKEQYFENHPYLTADAAAYLKENQVKMVGIDSHNIDDTRSDTRPVHSILLGADIPIVEHMSQLHLIPNQGFFFSAVPPKISGIGSFPVRAFAKF